MKNFDRDLGRKFDQTRKILFEPNFNPYAEGSCLVSFGNTKVLCTASYEEKSPRFLYGQNRGWLTAEYSMLPRATKERNQRESTQGKPSGRSQEIQRLIGRSLRASLDFKKFKNGQIIIDTDVIQADGGTRTSAITGGFVALALCIKNLLARGVINVNPIKNYVAAISSGVMDGVAIVDLDYLEDSNIAVDANFVFSDDGKIIEVQASGEGDNFTKEQFLAMYDLAYNSTLEIFALQRKVIGEF